mmetsp:Transcript_3114/g.7332  ORF Transcript_3114/g.7332 Transcript_3114/m.7332 type:complete len:109 (-) Transcript_3114:56-382(-)
MRAAWACVLYSESNCSVPCSALSLARAPCILLSRVFAFFFPFASPVCTCVSTLLSCASSLLPRQTALSSRSPAQPLGMRGSSNDMEFLCPWLPGARVGVGPCDVGGEC